MSGAHNKHIAAHAQTERVGLCITPNMGNRPESIAAYRWWIADNGCYSKGETFEPERWLGWLERCRVYLSTCKLAALPDVVGNWAATLERSAPYFDRVRALGYPVSVVLQDGAQIDAVPWDKIDAVFVGGTVPWKWGATAAAICAEAKRRGKWVHVGKVNSGRACQFARGIDADSVDGTFIRFGPNKNTRKVVQWLHEPQETLRLWA